MRKKDRAGENIVCLLDDFRMIGENGLHILLLGVMLGQQSLGLRWGAQDGVKPGRMKVVEGGGWLGRYLAALLRDKRLVVAPSLCW